MSQTPVYHMFVGVDIAAKTFTATWGPATTAPARPTVFAQNPDGFAAFHHALTETGRPADATLVVMEATGSYWVALAVYLHAAAYQVVVVNPAHIHNYANLCHVAPKRMPWMPVSCGSSRRSASCTPGRPHRWCITNSGSDLWRGMPSLKCGNRRGTSVTRCSNGRSSSTPSSRISMPLKLSWTDASRSLMRTSARCCVMEHGPSQRACSKAFQGLGRSQRRGSWLRRCTFSCASRRQRRSLLPV